ncbi:outer membrane protein [Methylobacterium planeticum]|uniref:Porin family protein n=1 Tax=Methylobacterium planeticum TaxID=2615211 RepID=A0A6N6MTH8_9HYPH|nr:outer membrane beta-barrel protein [Methylobacterium planeticum]KAB1074711.1 porin family protein [Methylobacterium planeticum]
MIAYRLRVATAALVLAGGGLSAGPARAADLLRPALVDPAPVAIGSGWYLRADFTESSYARPHDNTRPDPNDPGLPPLVGLRLSDTSGYGGGIGYRITPWLRIDATVDQRGAGAFRAYSSRTNFVTGANVEAGRIDALTGLVTVYADLGSWWGLTPYLGAGIGVSDVGVSRGYTQTTCYVEACDGAPGTGPRLAVARPNRSVASLAWALTGGVSYALGGGFSLDASYRYVDLGKAKSGTDPYGGSTRLKDLAASEFRLGLRYELAGLPGVPSLLGVGQTPYGN